MPSPSEKVAKLLEIVEHEDVYQFLGMDGDASLEDLQGAAEKKYASIHNQSSRNDVTRAGAELAGLCKSIFKDAGSRERYDKEREARSRRKAAADAAGTARRELVNWLVSGRARSALAPAGAYVARHSGSISSVGIVLIAVAITASYPGWALGVNPGLIGLLVVTGATAVFCGFTALLCKGSPRRVVIAGVAGIALVGSGIVEPRLGLLRVLGAVVLLCGSLSFGFRQSWHDKAIETARPIIQWWMGRPWFSANATAVVLGAILYVLLYVLAIVFGILAGTPVLITVLNAALRWFIIIVMIRLSWPLVRAFLEGHRRNP